MAFLFPKKREIHPIETFTEGALICSECEKRAVLSEFSPLEMGRCPTCNAPNFIPQKINKFWLFYPLGGGGMGAVYKAYHVDYPDSLFAVKVLPREQKNNPALIEGLKKEARIVTDLGEHPCMVNGVETGYEDGEHYLASEFIDGERLDKRIERLGKLPEFEVLLIALCLLSAETHIYNCGYLFRDLKPENVLITEDSGAHLYDYGICMTIEEALYEGGDIVEGSPFYMPPERLAGSGEGPYSEIYSLGMLLYHALVGRTYFSANELKQLARQLMRTMRLTNVQGKMKKIRPEMAEILDKMIKREPTDRYQSFIEVEKDIFRVVSKAF